MAPKEDIAKTVTVDVSITTHASAILKDATTILEETIDLVAIATMARTIETTRTEAETHEVDVEITEARMNKMTIVRLHGHPMLSSKWMTAQNLRAKVITSTI